MTDNTVVIHRIRSIESGTTDAILRARSTGSAVRARTDSIRTPGRPLRDSGVKLMMLAFIEYKNGLHEPTAGTAEETEADLPATEWAEARLTARRPDQQRRPARELSSSMSLAWHAHFETRSWCA